MMKPYVVSEDIEMLLGRWALARGLLLPSSAFFAGLMDEMLGVLDDIFGEVLLAEQVPISHQLIRRVQWTGLPAISMDGAYFESDYRIQVNRAVDAMGNDVGLLPRSGTLPFEQQLQVIRNQGLSEVVIVDDVVFSGQQMASVIRNLARLDVRVAKVFTGVSIGDGERMLAGMGVKWRSVYSLPEVIDEVCERDFYPGVPRSGRYVAGSDNVGLPYILPFGLPGKWASIPIDRQREFSLFCLAQTIRLFEAIEKASGRSVDCADIERKLPNMPATGRFTEFLKEAAQRVK